jgi:predicted nucleic acid-binding protein
MSTRYLIDKSAFARWAKPAVASVLDPLSLSGRLAVCGVIELELLHSARSSDDARRIRDGLQGFDWLPTPDEVWDRAAQIQSEMVARGSWRALSVSDLIIAAVAERHSATVLHYDGDFDLVAEVTDQPTQWVVPAGTAD